MQVVNIHGRGSRSKKAQLLGILKQGGAQNVIDFSTKVSRRAQKRGLPPLRIRVEIDVQNAKWPELSSELIKLSSSFSSNGCLHFESFDRRHE